MKIKFLAVSIFGCLFLFFGMLFLPAHSLSENLAYQSIDMDIVKTIESDGNPAAFNARTKCYGLYQISQICLEDFNQAHNSHYTCDELFDPEINEMVARWYFKRIEQLLARYNIPFTLTHLIASYNWGIGNVVAWYRSGRLPGELPTETQHYLARYLALANSR